MELGGVDLFILFMHCKGCVIEGKYYSIANAKSRLVK